MIRTIPLPRGLLGFFWFAVQKLRGENFEQFVDLQAPDERRRRREGAETVPSVLKLRRGAEGRRVDVGWW